MSAIDFKRVAFQNKLLYPTSFANCRPSSKDFASTSKGSKGIASKDFGCIVTSVLKVKGIGEEWGVEGIECIYILEHKKR